MTPLDIFNTVHLPHLELYNYINEKRVVPGYYAAMMDWIENDLQLHTESSEVARKHLAGFSTLSVSFMSRALVYRFGSANQAMARVTLWEAAHGF